jgi:hypothetical protein
MRGAGVGLGLALPAGSLAWAGPRAPAIAPQADPGDTRKQGGPVARLPGTWSAQVVGRLVARGRRHRVSARPPVGWLLAGRLPGGCPHGPDRRSPPGGPGLGFQAHRRPQGRRRAGFRGPGGGRRGVWSAGEVRHRDTILVPVGLGSGSPLPPVSAPRRPFPGLPPGASPGLPGPARRASWPPGGRCPPGWPSRGAQEVGTGRHGCGELPSGVGTGRHGGSNPGGVALLFPGRHGGWLTVFEYGPGVVARQVGTGRHRSARGKTGLTSPARELPSGVGTGWRRAWGVRYNGDL